MSSQDDKAANLERAEALVAQAAAWGPDLVVLPELWTYLGPRKRHAEVAEPIPGETSELLGRLASRYRFWLVGGSYLESVEGSDRFHNTSLAISPDGEIVARYRKLHLFDVEVEGKLYQESATMAPGSDAVVAQLGRATVGLSICYDLRFPELYRRLAARGARLVTVPAQFQMDTGRDHWEVLLRARAIENQVYVLAAAQCGTHPPTLQSYGNAMVVDPWGTVRARAGYREGVVVADLDFGEQERLREAFPVLRHRREDVFQF
jgi:predicted amidohydrolase